MQLYRRALGGTWRVSLESWRMNAWIYSGKNRVCGL